MESLILSKTSLPNLHPAMVHFPIALLLVALLIDIASLILSREWLHKTAILIYLLGAAAAGLTFWSGRSAAESVELSAGVEAVLSRHEDFATFTLWFFGIYAVIRFLIQFAAYKRWAHAVIIVMSIAGQALLIQTADLGGTLVYRHAVAVTPPANDQRKPHQVQAAAGPVIEGNDFTWNFGPGSETRFVEFFDSGGASIKSRTEKIDGRTVLTIEKSVPEPLLLTFKTATYSDVQIEIEMDLSGLYGAVSLVHHVNNKDNDFLTIEKTSMELGRHSADGRNSFGKATAAIPAGWNRFKAVAAGTHFRGYLNGNLIVHGHGTTAPEGKAGLLLDGTGILKITTISITVLHEQPH